MPTPATIQCRRSGHCLYLRFGGTWRIEQSLPGMDGIRARIDPDVDVICLNSTELDAWDSSFIAFLSALHKFTKSAGIKWDINGLDDNIQRLLELATSQPAFSGTEQPRKKAGLFSQVGVETVEFIKSTGEMTAFIGDAGIALVRFLFGRARFRRIDLGLFLQESGVQALPIISLISILVGVILAFVGIVQLKLFGAEIFVADLVGIGMIREMGAIMTGIVMAGRTGAAFAAQLGTMQVNEEIDALITLGISPMEFLILPRILALTLMMPFLVVFADLMGIVGGMIVGVGVYGMHPTLFVNRTIEAVGLNDLGIGLFMGLLFGALVAMAGCMRGIQCDRSAAAVGNATTSAVVTGIVSIIMATAVVTIICDMIGI